MLSTVLIPTRLLALAKAGCQHISETEQVSELFTRTLSLFEQRRAKVFTQVKTRQKLLLYTCVHTETKTYSNIHMWGVKVVHPA